MRSITPMAAPHERGELFAAVFVVSYLAFGIPFEVLVLQSFFRQVPNEIIESARIDGASNWRIFWTIMLPLSAPALVTVGILDAVSTWNELLFALIILNSDSHKTIPVGLLNFQLAQSLVARPAS